MMERCKLILLRVLWNDLMSTTALNISGLNWIGAVALEVLVRFRSEFSNLSCVIISATKHLELCYVSDIMWQISIQMVPYTKRDRNSDIIVIRQCWNKMQNLTSSVKNSVLNTLTDFIYHSRCPSTMFLGSRFR